MTTQDVFSSGVQQLNKSNALRKRTVIQFMDIVILTELQNCSMSGYDVMAFIHKKYGVGVSSGTVYSMLYAMERDGLIEGIWSTRKRVYRISNKEMSGAQILLKAYAPLQDFIRKTSMPEAGVKLHL